jgi:23S rRNA (adenine2030-N6)-methyltransferase
MLSYRHAFHAGGAADVHKHAVLALLLEHFRSREKPFAVIDVYAGRGIYGLNSEEAQKRKEFAYGIAKVIGLHDRPAMLDGYWGAVEAVNEAVLVRYPGSPQIVRHLLREGDELIVNELHPADHEDLRRWAGEDARIHVHRRDALEAMVALVPPTIRRGLVLVDPAYEIKTEYETVAVAVSKSFAKWPQGVFAVWYPVLAEARYIATRQKLLELIPADILQTEFDLGRAKSYDGMQSSGLWIINPPWKIDEAIDHAGLWLAKQLGQERPARHRLTWLRKNPE